MLKTSELNSNMVGMTGQHFKEILGSICLSTGGTKSYHTGLCKITRETGISQTMLHKYCKYGVPMKRKESIMRKLKNYLFTNL